MVSVWIASSMDDKIFGLVSLYFRYSFLHSSVCLFSFASSNAMRLKWPSSSFDLSVIIACKNSSGIWWCSGSNLTFYWPINCMFWKFGRRIEGLLEEYKGSITVELQQRSVEFGSIIRRHSNMALVLQTLSAKWSFIIRAVQCSGWYNLYFCFAIWTYFWF